MYAIGSTITINSNYFLTKNGRCQEALRIKTKSECEKAAKSFSEVEDKIAQVYRGQNLQRPKGCIYNPQINDLTWNDLENNKNENSINGRRCSPEYNCLCKKNGKEEFPWVIIVLIVVAIIFLIIFIKCMVLRKKKRKLNRLSELNQPQGLVIGEGINQSQSNGQVLVGGKVITGNGVELGNMQVYDDAFQVKTKNNRGMFQKQKVAAVAMLQSTTTTRPGPPMTNINSPTQQQQQISAAPDAIIQQQVQPIQSAVSVSVGGIGLITVNPNSVQTNFEGNSYEY